MMSRPSLPSARPTRTPSTAAQPRPPFVRPSPSRSQTPSRVSGWAGASEAARLPGARRRAPESLELAPPPARRTRTCSSVSPLPNSPGAGRRAAGAGAFRHGRWSWATRAARTTTAGLVYLRRKQFPQAIAALEAAVRQDAGGDDARYRLGRASLAAGQTARGQAQLQQFEHMRKRSRRSAPAAPPRPQPGDRRRADGWPALRRNGRTKEALQQCRTLTAAGSGDAECTPPWSAPQPPWVTPRPRRRPAPRCGAWLWGPRGPPPRRRRPRRRLLSSAVVPRL